MERKSVTSSNIRSIGYDPKTKTLEIEFKGGGVYSYEGVTQEHHNDFMASDSKGSHFHTHIRSNYAGKKAVE